MACNSTPYSDSLSLRLRLNISLTLLQTITRWLMMQKARGHAGIAPVALPLLIGDQGFRSISLPSSGVFSPFPHGTSSLSVSGEYLALEDGPPSFAQDCTCPELLRIPLRKGSDFSYGAITRCGRSFQTVRLSKALSYLCGPTTPAGRTGRFRLVPLRSPLLRESLC